DYLVGASKAWKDKFEKGRTEIKWPVGVGKPQNPGVAGHVRDTEGAIGYVELLYALQNNIKYGAVQNKDGDAFIHAKVENVTAAAKGGIAEIPEDLTFSLNNKPGKDSYPICGAVWAVCYQNQPANAHKVVTDFLHWVTHEGQKYAKELHYAPLPDEL